MHNECDQSAGEELCKANGHAMHLVACSLERPRSHRRQQIESWKTLVRKFKSEREMSIYIILLKFNFCILKVFAAHNRSH